MATFVAHAQYELYVPYVHLLQNNIDFHDLIMAALAPKQVGTVT